MNILSTFGGIECGKVALDKAGIKYNKYYSSEIDKYALQIANKNHPDIIQLGDIQFITGQQFDAVGGIDILIGGSPCQGFSFAGKQLNFDDPRSALFFEFVRLKRELKPKYFLLENVKMKKEFQHIITEYLGVEPIEINSALVSAQNRKRLYWTNIPGIEQPEDKGILLKDILEQEVDDKYYLSDKLINGLINGSPAFKGRFNPHTEETKKSYCLTSRYYKMGKTDPYIVVQRGRYNKDGSTSQQLEPRDDKKANCVTTVQKDNMILQRSHGFNKGGLFEGKSPTLLSNSWQHNNHVINNYSIRRLTPIECERLQTLPDNYTEGVSDTQRYKALGNGWTVDVIVHILKNIPQ